HQRTSASGSPRMSATSWHVPSTRQRERKWYSCDSIDLGIGQLRIKNLEFVLTSVTDSRSVTRILNSYFRILNCYGCGAVPTFPFTSTNVMSLNVASWSFTLFQSPTIAITELSVPNSSRDAFFTWSGVTAAIFSRKVSG